MAITLKDLERAQTIVQMVERKIIFVKHDNRIAFAPSFLTMVGGEIVIILNSNRNDPLIILDLKKHKRELVLLAIFNALSKLYTNELFSNAFIEAMNITESMIDGAFPK